MAVEIVKMSSKGQVVIPQEVRSKLKLLPGERFIAVPVGKDVLFRRIDLDLDGLARNVKDRFNREGITKGDVVEAVRWSRK
jgi:antitoxin PrlF